jgi:hypothetical protein
MSEKRHVFISYSRRDDAFVLRLYKDLQSAGLQVWIDKEGLQPGTPNWEKAIRQAIDEAYAVVWIASPDSRASNYVQDELALANERGCPVYPIWASGESWLDCVPLGMGKIQYQDVRGERYDDVLPAVVSALYQYAGDAQNKIGLLAEEVFHTLDEEAQKALPRLFTQLVLVDENGKATARRTQFTGGDAENRLLERLTAEQLLHCHTQDGQIFFEVAHEALLTSWERFKSFIEEHKEDLRQLHRLEQDAQEWVRLNRPKHMLWAHERLKPIYLFCQKLGITLDPLTMEFARSEVDRLFEEFKDEQTPNYRKRQIIDDFSRINEEANIPIMVASLRYVYKFDRSTFLLICHALAAFPAVSLSCLMPFLQDQDENMRFSVVQALGQLADDSTMPALFRALQDDTSVFVRHAAAEALGLLGEQSAVPFLVQALKTDIDEDVRSAAAFALGKLGDASVVDILSEALKSSENIRVAAAWSLAQFGDFQGASLLIPALQSSSWADEAKLKFAKVLEQWGTPEATKALQYWRERGHWKRRAR